LPDTDNRCEDAPDEKGFGGDVGIILAISALNNAYVIDYAELLAPGTRYAYPVAISNSDVVAGYMNNGSTDMAFTHSNGTYAMTPPGSTWSYATAINNSGVLAGWAVNARSSHYGYGYFTYSDGTSTSIGTPPTWWLTPILLAPVLAGPAAVRRRFGRSALFTRHPGWAE
jgi:hypothetical protein